MLEIRKGTAAKNYENTFFREFAENLQKMFDKYSLDGLLIANSVCEIEKRLQIDALLITKKAVCIIDFKNFGGKILLPKNAKSEFEYGKWCNESGEIIKGGNSINPFIQLRNQKERFVNVVKDEIQNKIPKQDRFNPFHTVRIVCFQKSIELAGSIPSKEELNFFIIDKTNYLERIRDIIDISDGEVNLSMESYSTFKEVFRADQFDLSEQYEQFLDYTSYETTLDFESLYDDQKAALSEIESFLKSDDRFFILQGTSLSGKTHLLPYIQDVAFNNQISEAKLFASSGRVANNLLKDSKLEFDSVYSYIYGGNIHNKAVEDTGPENENGDENLNLEIVPLKKSDDTEEALFIADESHLISDNYHQSVDLRFGSGKLLKDFIEFADLANTNRKIIFVGDSYQLSIGKKEECSLNPEYLSDEYGFNTRAFQLIDKPKKSPIVGEALTAVENIRQQSFNKLSFGFSDTMSSLLKESLKSEIEDSLKSTKNIHILCYSNYDAQKVNLWIKNSILKNGSDLTKGDLVVFGNNIRVEDENDPFAEPKKVYNGQFGTVLAVAEPIIKTEKLLTPLSFRELTLQLYESNYVLSFLSLENFRLSDKGELSKEEIISYKLLLNQLAEKEIDKFKNGYFYADEELSRLLKAYDSSTRKGISKIIRVIQKHLRNVPSSDYYKFKNAAQLRFGWALTVHKAMSYKWDVVFFNVETGGGKTNETYFRWVYTGLIRANQKVNLINYESITPFYKMDVNPTVPIKSPTKDFFYIADPTSEISNQSGDIIDKYQFPDIEIKSSLIQLFQFINSRIPGQELSIESIKHPKYQELYEIKGGDGELATISIYYNKKGQFKIPSLMQTEPKEFGEEVITLLLAENSLSDFSFIKDNWRRQCYEQMNEILSYEGFMLNYIIQSAFKDTLQLTNSGNKIVIDFNYDGDGFFTKVNALSTTDSGLWIQLQEILTKIKDK